MATAKGGYRTTSEALLGMITIYEQGLVPAVAVAEQRVGVEATKIMANRMARAVTHTGKRRLAAGGAFAGRIAKTKTTEGSLYFAIWDKRPGIDEPGPTVNVKPNRNGNVTCKFYVEDPPAHFYWQEYGTSRSGPSGGHGARGFGPGSGYLGESNSKRKSPRGPGIPGMFAYTAGWAYFSSRVLMEVSRELDKLGRAASSNRAATSAAKMATKTRSVPASYASGLKRYADLVGVR